MKTIVCAVDDSPSSVAAVRVASELGESLGARLVLAHVAQRLRPSERGIEQQAREGAMQLLDRVARDHGLAGAVDQRAEVGDPVIELSRIAVEESAVLILVGTQSQNWGRLRLPSRFVAELSGSASCHVLVVPPGAGAR